MPYIGHEPTNSGNFYILDDFNGLGQDGSSSTYDQNANGTIVNYKLMVAGVAITPNVDNLIVTIDGVLQHPTDAYTISGSILTFDGAPASGVDFHVVIMGQSSTVGEGSIGADELQVSGDGTNNQLLKSDGDGTMSWINQNTVTASTAATLATARTIGGTSFNGSANIAVALAATATTLATTRAINGVNFDGSAAITVTADANTLSGTTLKSTVVSSSLESVGTLTALTGGTGDLIWDTPTFVVDSSASVVGIGASPDGHHLLQITKPSGTLSATGYPSILNLEGNTYTTSQNITRIRSINIDPMTINGSDDVANAMSVYIGGAPTISTSGGGTKTAHALYVASGNNYFGGKVDIGGTPTTALLGVYTSNNNGGEWLMRGRNDDSTAGENNGFYLRAGTNSSDSAFTIEGYDDANKLFKVRGDGNVGIGTTAPDKKMHIATAGGNGQLRLQNTDGQSWDFYSYNDNNLYINDAGGTLVTITDAGDVGIGTSTPNAKLSIQDGGTEYGATATTLLVGKKNQSHSSVCITNESGDAHTWFNYENGDNYITSDSSDTAGDTYFRDWDGSNYSTHMVISGDGYVTKPLQPAFSALSSTSGGSGASGVQIFATQTLNQGSHYNTSNGRFTAPVAGVYHFAGQILSNAGALVRCDFQINGTSVRHSESTHGSSGYTQTGYDASGLSLTISLSASDYVNLHSSYTNYGSSYSFFSGHLVG